MSNSSGFDFTQFVPGFDYLKNLTPGASGTSAAPGWVAPTLDPEELDKRIQELKTVQFWLEQNAKAVGATIQALEVQRMTLATLKGMNMSFHDLAESLKIKPDPAPDQPQAAAQKRKGQASGKTKASTHAAGVDPAQWWGALTHQFQHIAQQAMADITRHHHAGAAQTNPPNPNASAAAMRNKKTNAANAKTDTSHAAGHKSAKPARRANRKTSSQS